MRQGVYAELGEYHRNVSKKWKYYALYMERNRVVRKELEALKKNSKIVDLGCGEGVLVEELVKRGYDAIGLDKNYSSKYVKKGDMARLPFKDKSFDIVLSLDSLQYLTTSGQKKALKEMLRVLKHDGKVIFAVPNKKHFAARIIKLLTGTFPKTDSKTPPAGDKGIREYLAMINNAGLEVKKIKGILPTYFILSTFLITTFPSKFQWLLRIIDLFALPSLSFLNCIVAVKR
jgi:ubiquinone/menaquinone biosynthesis C-methylase UbiE